MTEPERIIVVGTRDEEVPVGGGDSGFLEIPGRFPRGKPSNESDKPDGISGGLAPEPETPEERWARWDSYMSPALLGGIKAALGSIFLGLVGGPFSWAALPAIMFGGVVASVLGDEGKWWWDKLTAEDQKNVESLMQDAAEASVNALAALPVSELHEDNRPKLKQIGFDAAKTFIANELGKPGRLRLSNLPRHLPKQPPTVAPRTPAPATTAMPEKEKPKIERGDIRPIHGVVFLIKWGGSSEN
ncbi:hypothetical protein QFC21_005271 [Naganishia friedmannii]|uniref:Uncharacterized protein n=1 Tax=Naganishia friedmannii TaxID=89922 RepID=A0ACC2VBV5_9TREE|nr:hypothetical protein QFC21_005271 [Naganishia friedmannii]